MDLFLVYLLRETDRVFSRDLVAELLSTGDRPWAELRKGKPVTEGWLAKQLRPYGVNPRTIRMGDQVAKGYLKEDFTDTFRRYIPKAEVEATKADLAARVVPNQKTEMTGSNSALQADSSAAGKQPNE